MMYYYLIAGMPDLSLNLDNKIDDFNGVLDTIQRNLELSDERLFRYVLYPNDNRNLLNTLFVKYKEFPQTEFISPAVYSKKEIEEYHKNTGIFPNYIGEFLRDFEDQFHTMSMQDMEDRLLRLFYDEASKTGSFIAIYYQFEQEIKEFFSAYNYSYFNFMNAPTHTEVKNLDQIGKGKSVPIDVLRDHPYAELIDEAISSHQPLKIEQIKDRIIWDYLDNVTGFFGINQVLVYTLRLMMIHRWQTLTTETGKNRFGEIQERIKNYDRTLN